MLDIGFSELTLIGVLALLVLGPKRLPEAARIAGLWVGRLRSFIANVRQDLDRELQGGELDELRRLKRELDDTRAMIRQQSSETFEQLRALDDMITAENSIQPETEDRSATSALASPARPRKKGAKKKAARKKTAKKAATVKKSGTKKKTGTPRRPRKK
jgi:sec-independent protein translocase protein TatB